MTLKELVDAIYKIIPNAVFDEDNEGQIIIHTNKREMQDGEELSDFEIID